MTTPLKPARSTSSPVYQRIEGELRERIARGEWMVGTMLPSRQRLSAEYGVNLGTIQRALSALLADGTVRAEEGRGTFVAERGTVTPRANGNSDHGGPARPVEVGVVLCSSSVSADWQHRLLHSLETVLLGKNRRMRFIALGWQRRPWLDLSVGIEQLADQGVKAIAVVDIYSEVDARQLRGALQGREPGGLPLVLMTAQGIPHAVPHLFYDHEAAGMQAVYHLLENGWEELAFVAPFAASWQEDRVVGAGKAMESSGTGSLRVVPGDAERVPHAPGVGAEPGYHAAGPLLTTIVSGRAGIICANDKVARGVLRAAGERGLVAGRDFGLIGFDDDPESRLVGLSSLHPPLEALGQEMGYLLEQALAGRITSHQVRLRSHLIARESSLGMPR